MKDHRSDYRTLQGPAAASLLLITAGMCGCSDRILTIERADVINISADSVRGDPLSLDIVILWPDDFDGEPKWQANQDLLPEKTITADVWFKRKPTPQSAQDDDVDHFLLDEDQIVSFTDRKGDQLYGIRRDGRLRGLRFAPKPTKKVTIPVKGDIHHRRSAIYVFGKFTNPRGEVLPTRPAVFSPVAAYRKKITVYIDGKGVCRVTEPEIHLDRVVEGAVRSQKDTAAPEVRSRR